MHLLNKNIYFLNAAVLRYLKTTLGDVHRIENVLQMTKVEICKRSHSLQDF